MDERGFIGDFSGRLCMDGQPEKRGQSVMAAIVCVSRELLFVHRNVGRRPVGV